MLRSTVRTAVALTLAGTLAVLGPPPAGARDDDVERRGSCTRGAEWRLEVKEDDGRLEVELRVDGEGGHGRGDRSWQLWRWRLLHDGYVSAKGSATTRGRSGSFDVERRMTDNSGDDVVAFRARNAATRESCAGSVTW